MPEDLSSDPRIENTSQVKSMAFDTGVEDTPLFLEGVRLAVGAEELNKSVNVIEFLGTEVSADLSDFGTVTASLSIDGGVTFPPGLSNEFDTHLEEFDVASAGTAYKSLLVRLSLSHQSGTAKTPNGLPVQVTATHQWPRLRSFLFYVTRQQDLELHSDLLGFLDTAKTLIDGKVTQPLSFGRIANVPVKMDAIGWQNVNVDPSGFRLPPTDFVDPSGRPSAVVIAFSEVRGSGAAS
ncbi:MAG: hypothetical protein GEU71_16810 [Actinobacteria bacterium]|nr:hypothetical protein [Actinomycetota bacterium]